MEKLKRKNFLGQKYIQTVKEGKEHYQENYFMIKILGKIIGGSTIRSRGMANIRNALRTWRR